MGTRDVLYYSVQYEIGMAQCSSEYFILQSRAGDKKGGLRVYDSPI